MNATVDEYLSKVTKWKPELSRLRTIINECGLSETIKWGVPCFTAGTNNIVIINGFKEFCCISFFKGALLKDTSNILIKQGENTQSARIIKFISLQDINKTEKIIKKYIKEAVEIENAGIKVPLKDNTQIELAAELVEILAHDTKFKSAFESLTPGRQRAYNLFFTSPVQSSTRITRIEKYRQQILDGKGINDCTCGLSKKMPNCDGSHKFLRVE